MYICLYCPIDFIFLINVKFIYQSGVARGGDFFFQSLATTFAGLEM